MSKQHIVALDYIRGLSMLGVLGIHTGAYSLTNPAANPHLFALLEIVSRFSVPIFFFVSAFGLFISQPLQKEFHYFSFMRRRFTTVLLPYLAWSLLYMLHYTWTSGDVGIWDKPKFYEFLFFGLASYQLYFLVILIWFYALMPVWRKFAGFLLKNPPAALLLLIVQIAFNYYSSYLLKPDYDSYYLNLLVQYRMSFLILHYVFIFMMGALCAELYPQFKAVLERKKSWVTTFFIVSLAGMVGFYYYLVYGEHYSLEAAVNTIHQLSPIGVLYTISATFFWFAVFSRQLPEWVASCFSRLGEHSYLIYLVHPLVMYYAFFYLEQASLIFTPSITIAFYAITLTLSTGLAIIVKKIGSLIPLLGLALTGSFPKQNTFKQKA